MAANDCEILVRVSGNDLQFNENVWQKFNTAKYASNPLIVLSVIGQPKSRKTSLMNHVLALLSQDESISPKYLFPLSGNDKFPWENDQNFEEGILACTLECRIGCELYTFLLLDIWSPSETPRMEIYNKLMDFCLIMSSAVIFSESWEQEVSIIYWLPELSTLSQFDRSPIGNSLPLYFLTSTDDCNGTSRNYLNGCPLEYHCGRLMLARTRNAISTAKLDTIWQLLLKCITNPVRINDSPVNATQIGKLFGKCVEIINGSPSEFVSTITVDSEFNSDIEMKDLSGRGAKEDDPDKANEASFSENASNVSISSAVDFDAKTDSSVSSLTELCLDYNDIIERSLSEYDWECKDFQKEAENILKEVLSKNVTESDWQKSQLEEQTKICLSKLAEMLGNYKSFFTELLEEKVCVTEVEFDKLHIEGLINAEKETSASQKLNEIFEKISVQQKLIFLKSNRSIYKDEEQDSEKAYEFALMKFESLLTEKLSTNTFSEREFPIVYQLMATATVNLFLAALEPPHTKPWIVKCQDLEKWLTSLKASYMDQNRFNLSRKKAIETGKQYYKDEMTNALPVWRLPDDKLDSVSKTCCDAAMRIFYQKIGKNIPVKWEDEMKTAINEIKLVFVAKNYNLPAPIAPTIQLQPSVAHFGIGLYIDHQRVLISIDRRNAYESSCMQNSSDNIQYEYDPNIAVVNDAILLAEDASAVNMSQRVVRRDTVYGLLTSESLYTPVNIAGNFVYAGPEEILSLYFHRIRMQLQSKFNHRFLSCFVATTGLLTSGAKQMLKSSLTLAGFEKNTLISSTTAMAISHSRNLLNEDLCNQVTYPTLSIYTSPNLVEVAVADVSGNRVTVKALCGCYVKESDLQKELKNILRDLSHAHQYKNVILFIASKSQPMDAMQQMVLNLMEHKFYTRYIDSMDIIRVTALLDLVHNGYAAVPPIPVYNSVHPYRITVKTKGKEYRLSDFNNYKDQQLRLAICGDGQYIDIIEKALISKEKSTVRRYNLISKHIKIHKAEIQILLTKEGNLYVELNADGYMEKSNVTSMTSIGRNDLFAFMTPIIKNATQQFERKYCVLEPPPPCNSNDVTTSSRLPSNTIDAANEKLLEDLKESLANLIATTKRELGSSRLTHTAHRDNIETKISKCEELLTSSNIKVKQLEIEKSNLERAAKFIK